MPKQTITEKENDARFANRRRMAFWSLYAILFVTLSVTIKILIVPSISIDPYTQILSWSMSVLGGIVLAYIGAASYEQSGDKSKVIINPDVVKENNEDDSDNNYEYEYDDHNREDYRINGRHKT